MSQVREDVSGKALAAGLWHYRRLAPCRSRPLRPKFEPYSKLCRRRSAPFADYFDATISKCNF